MGDELDARMAEASLPAAPAAAPAAAVAEAARAAADPAAAAEVVAAVANVPGSSAEAAAETFAKMVREIPPGIRVAESFESDVSSAGPSAAEAGSAAHALEGAVSWDPPADDPAPPPAAPAAAAAPGAEAAAFARDRKSLWLEDAGEAARVKREPPTADWAAPAGRWPLAVQADFVEVDF